MANLSQIKLPNGTTYDIKDNGALQLTGGQVTGPVTFGNSVSVDEAILGDLVVNGSASFTNNIQANTINGVVVGSSPKFTDTNTEVSTLTLAAGSTAGTALTSGGKFTLTAGSKTVSFTMPTIPSVPSNIVNTITTTAGAHTAITSQKGNVSFSVPTKTSHLTNDSGFLTSHQDISGKADKATTVSNIVYDSTNTKITKTINGTTSDVITIATLKTALGSMPASDVYSWAKASTKPTYTASEVGALPSSTTIPAITLNGAENTSPSFYAPTTAGTNGYVLKSNGSGAPTWTNATLTDTKVTTAALTSGATYYPILATGTGTATRQIDSTLRGFTYKSTAGTASVVGSAVLTLGNNTSSGTANNEEGILRLYGKNTYYTTLKTDVSSADKEISLPNKSGTLATINDITDEKLEVNELTSGTTYYPILATGTGTATRQIDSTLQSFTYTATAGTASTNGTSALELGNSIASGTANNQQGGLILYSTTRFPTAIKAGTLTSGRTLTLPDKTGTVALTDDLLDLNIGIDESTQLEFSSGFLVMPETLAEALTQIDDGFLDIWQVATTSRMGMMSNTDKIYLNGLSDAIGTTSSTITIKNGSSGGRAFYLETSSSDSDDVSLTAMIVLLEWDSDVIVS